MVRIPFFKNKQYLTGMDWVMLGFDYLNKRATGAGNMFQIVIELDGVVSEEDFRGHLRHFIGKFPVVNGRVRRDYRLAPYWEMPSHTHGTALPLDVYHLDSADDVSSVLEMGVNKPFNDKRQHLAFHLILAGQKSYAAVTFDHCLFDANGAEAFLRMFQLEWEKKGTCTWEFHFSEPAHLNEWRRKFEAGRQVNRALLRLAENAPPRTLPLVPPLTKQGFKFSVISFSKQQSKKIMASADNEAGYLMAMPYAMALTVQVLDGIFANRGIDTGDYIIPVSVDARRQINPAQEVFFNHVSILLFRIEAREADDFSVLLTSIKRQMYEQVKAGLARDLWEASFLTRIVPLPILSHLMRIYFKGEIASFCFSFLGETGHMPTRFMGKTVKCSYHMPRVPTPPGLGVFFHQSQGRLTVYLSYAQGLLRKDEVNTIVDTLKARLAE